MATLQQHSISPVLSEEQRFVVEGVAWKDYVILREALDIPGLRMSFFRGRLELMSPSRKHEVEKKTIARLLEVYALERDVPIQGMGSMTLRREDREAGAEPDECYSVGNAERDVPDFAIEVIVRHGGIEKLLIYEALGVREVWLWKDDAFQLYLLGAQGYAPIPRSEALPNLDLQLLAEHVRMPNQHEAAKAFRDRLRGQC